jgi:NAD(P)-dependent dehydrogenase (short-subunit alcohol dehydrogenase family)
MTQTRKLAGRHVLITGASSGFGAHFARIAAAAGAAVTIGARRTERLETLADEIRAAGGKALAIPVDVTEEASVMAAFNAAEAALGPVDGVIANAGLTISGSALDMKVEDFDQVFAVNVRGVFLTAREGARHMRASGMAERGRIVLVSSITANQNALGIMPYCSSKAAVTRMGKNMAREWVRQGPNVNILSPGYVDTELAGEWFSTSGGEKQIAGFPRKRLMSASALDETLLYLLSDDSQSVTGSDFTIDDGQSL